MAINSKDFIPRPGFVNKQGCLPDPKEICCIQVPKVFDQCLKRECLKPSDDCEQLCKQIPGVTDQSQVKCIGCCKNLKVICNSVTTCPATSAKPGYKKVTINYTVTFDVDVDIKVNDVESTETLNYSINKTINICKFYCPDTIAKSMVCKQCGSGIGEEINDHLIKLEVVGDFLSTDISKINCCDNSCCSCSCSCTDNGNNEDKKVFLCITLGLFIIVKCEIVVQLMIPAYGYCPAPEEECPCSEDPCKEFMKRELPELYPPQEMDDLFDDCDCEEYEPKEKKSIVEKSTSSIN